MSTERAKPVYEYEVREELTVVNSYLVNATSKAEAKRLVLEAQAGDLSVVRSDALPTGRWWVGRGNRVPTRTVHPAGAADTHTTGAGA